MKRMLTVVAFGLFLAAPTLFGQADPAPATRDQSNEAKARARAAVTDGDVTYGRIKELTAGQKVVIDVDDAPDKDFDLSDRDLKVTLAKNLQVGDTVKVTEHSKMGKTQSVVIAKHSGGGVTHGDQDKARTRTKNPN